MGIQDVREEAAAALRGEGFTASAYPPERISAPIAYVQAASPYLTAEGVPFGHAKVNLEIRLVPHPSTNNQVTVNALDEDITNAVIALINAKFSVGETSQPYSLVAGSGTFTAVSITVSKTIRIGD